MAITEHYEPYSFSDDSDGPGCGHADHDPACDCDIDVTLSPAYGKPNAPALAFAAAARAAVYERDVAPTFENFAAELLGMYETARELGVRLSKTPDELEELRSTYWEKLGADNDSGVHDGQACHDEVKAMLRAGLTVAATARFIERSRNEVLGQLVTAADYDMNALEYVVDALLAGATSYYKLAQETGISKLRIRGIAAALGVQSVCALNSQRGGGDKYTPEQYAEIERLWKQGKWSYSEIAEKVGVANRSAVAKIVQRRFKGAA